MTNTLQYFNVIGKADNVDDANDNLIVNVAAQIASISAIPGGVKSSITFLTQTQSVYVDPNTQNANFVFSQPMTIVITS